MKFSKCLLCEHNKKEKQQKQKKNEVYILCHSFSLLYWSLSRLHQAIKQEIRGREGKNEDFSRVKKTFQSPTLFVPDSFAPETERSLQGPSIPSNHRFHIFITPNFPLNSRNNKDRFDPQNSISPVDIQNLQDWGIFLNKFFL